MFRRSEVFCDICTNFYTLCVNMSKLSRSFDAPKNRDSREVFTVASLCSFKTMQKPGQSCPGFNLLLVNYTIKCNNLEE